MVLFGAISQDEMLIPPNGLLLVTREPNFVSTAPGPHIRGNNLKAFSLVSHMFDVGQTLLRRDESQSTQYRFGFHEPPLNSVNHLHLHCLALPFTPRYVVHGNVNQLYSQHPFSSLQQQQQALHSQLGMNSGGSSGLHMLHSDSGGGSGSLGRGFPDFGRGGGGEGFPTAGRGGSKQDMGSSEGRGGSSGGHGGDGGETLYLKSIDD